jgi:hypothetical protein
LHGKLLKIVYWSPDTTTQGVPKPLTRDRIESREKPRYCEPRIARCRDRQRGVLSKPFSLADGRPVATIDDARKIIPSLPVEDQDSPSWQYVCELITKAADNGDPQAVLEASVELRRALNAQGLL